MASPGMIRNAPGNALASQSLGAASTITVTIDVSSDFQCQLQVQNTSGSATSAGAAVNALVYRLVGSGSGVQDSSPISQISIPTSTTANTAQLASLTLETGRYNVTLTNTDSTNAVTILITADFVNQVS